MMRYTILLFLIFLVSLSRAQTQEDVTIFTAMGDEQARTKEQLTLPMMSKPFYVSYALLLSQQFSVEATLGSVLNSVNLPLHLMGTSQVLIGDYNRTSDLRHVGQFLRVDVGGEIDYNAIRLGFWLASDQGYKVALQEYSAKKAYLEANPYELPDNLPDLLPTPSVEKLIQGKQPYISVISGVEAKARELSAVFKDYKEIVASKVSLQGSEMTFYKLTTEQVALKQPLNFVELYVEGTVVTKNGEYIRDSYVLLAPSLEALPSQEHLKQVVAGFARRLIDLKNAEVFSEEYNGPVLFENEAVRQILTDNLLGNNGGLCTYRMPLGVKETTTSFEDKIGKKLLDPRLSVVNYSSMTEYMNIPLLGSYEVDAEGVVPEKEMMLVEKGVLKKVLNGQIPTSKVRYSTGSSRFIPTRNDVIYVTAPGTLHIKADGGLKPEAMKKALLKAAKEAKSGYAYIVRRLAGNASLLYKVDVKTGEETQVRFGKVAPVNMSKLKNIREICNQEKVHNLLLDKGALVSMIYPSSILLNNMDISVMDVPKRKLPALKNPLQER
ncbi:MULTISPECIES: metallopeptidase TldD-related protein [Butyricimonas]|uniref:metallopeptidase TldD-related protein n=1 Tax=Butyricimonas TaxID=574697 RepID=UPI001D0725B2|nr:MULTISPECIES: metallopeptidase TldD-related protein [Butyricimonas]MCG4519051.1 metallopeptidase TldD-related protein [Butyricimonas sp. DFI.6.44]